MPASLKLCITAAVTSTMARSFHMVASLLGSSPKQRATGAHRLYLQLAHMHMHMSYNCTCEIQAKGALMR
jgi:hypothetical protein